MAVEIEAPPIIQKRRYTKRDKSDSAEKTKKGMVAFAHIGVSSIFKTLSMKFGEHWVLTDKESVEFSEALDDALQSLSGDFYVKLLAKVDQFGPWLALAWCANNIVTPRIRETNAANARARKSETKVADVSRAEPEPIRPNWSDVTAFDLSGNG